jgi:hypothetical protein
MESKRSLLLGLLIIIPFVTPWATESDSVKRVGTTVEVSEEDDRLDKITKIPDVSELIEKVRSQRDPDKKNDPLSEADWNKVWEGVQEKNGLEEQVFAILNGKSKNGKGEVSQNEMNHNYDLGNFEKKQTKSLLKLQEYLKERLQKKLFGEDPSQTSGVKAVADHNLFHKLYSSQIGKNLMVELANYCIHSDPTTGIVPYKESDKDKALFYRKLNSDNLNQYASAGGSAQGQKPFDNCVGRIGISCDAGTSYPTIKVNEKVQENFPEFGGDTATEQQGQSVRIPKPCEISRYMTAVKITLKQLEEYEKENQIASGRSSASYQVEIKQKESLDIDSVVNISSGELLNGEGNEYREEAEREALAAQECIIQGSESCDDSYTVDAEESSSIQDEFNLRNFAMQKKLVNEVLTEDADVQQMTEFLKNKGMTEGNIERLVSKIRAENDNISDLDIYKKIIEERFENERIALAASLKSRLNDNAQADPKDATKAQEKAESIKKAIEDSPMQLAQVFQYANVVSSFLKVDRGDGSSSTNSAALAAELENPFNTQADPRAPGNQPQDLSALEEFASEQPAKEDEQGSAVLGSKEIDKIQFSITGDAQEDNNE